MEIASFVGFMYSSYNCVNGGVINDDGVNWPNIVQ